MIPPLIRMARRSWSPARRVASRHHGIFTAIHCPHALGAPDPAASRGHAHDAKTSGKRYPGIGSRCTGSQLRSRFFPPVVRRLTHVTNTGHPRARGQCARLVRGLDRAGGIQCRCARRHHSAFRRGMGGCGRSARWRRPGGRLGAALTVPVRMGGKGLARNPTS